MAPRKGGSRGRPSAPPIPVPAAYPPRKDNHSGQDEPQWRACRDMLEAVYKAKEGSRRMCDIFRELPDKDEYPDYYEAISEPECLDNIAARLGSQDFDSPEAFFRQLHLVFQNAMHYNEEGSQVWNDAKKFETSIHDAWRAHAEQGTFAGSKPGKPAARKPAPKSSAAPAHSVVQPPTSTPQVTIHLRAPRTSVKHEPTTPGVPAPADAQTPPTRSREPRTRAAVTSPQKVMPSRAAKDHSAHGAATPLSPSDKAVMDALDGKLPMWDGPQSILRGDPAPGGILGSGWWGEGSPDYERRVGGHASWKGRIRVVAEAIDAYKDVHGVRLSETLAQLPVTAEIPHLPSNAISWGLVLQRARGSGYSTLLDFDKDMVRLFERCRRWLQGNLEQYGHVLTLQRLYNAITAPYPMPVPPNGVVPPSPTKFASLPAGPGSSPEEPGFGVTTYRIPFKDRHFTEEARHKGVAYRAGDYVHLINPDDASRPIVAQVFKTFVPTKGYSTHHVTVCWYFRPEQTTHPIEQLFVENEVFKTAHFCDHPVEDILERISVQPTESASLGRPLQPNYFPGWPLYVCSARYIDKACLFMRIKKWSNVLPEQLRGSDVSSVIPFERTIHLPSVKSPFARGVQGPGSVGRPKRQPIPADDEEEEAAAAVVPPQGSRRTSGPQDSRSRAATTPSTPGPIPPQRHPYAAAAPPQGQAQPGPSRSSQTPSGFGSPAPPQQPSRRDTGQGAQYRTPQPPVQAPLYPVRTFAAVMGGAQVLEQVAVREFLPPDTARLFEQDARHQVLWFSGPPIAPGALKIPAQPSHSFEYLAFLAKRKSGASVQDARPAKRLRPEVEAVWMDVTGSDAEGEDDAEGSDEGGDAKRVEDDLEGDLHRHWWAQGQTEEQVFAGLRSVAGV